MTRAGELETRLFGACVAASVVLHAAALALGPHWQAARVERPHLLSVVLAAAQPTGPLPEESTLKPPPPRPVAPRPRARPAPAPAPQRAAAGSVPAAPAATASETARPQEVAPLAAPAAPIPVTAVPEPERASVVPPDFRAAYLDNPPPAYPRSARRNGDQGTVTLRVHVGTDGVPTAVELERSSGSSALDAAARESVKSWRFAPARRGVEPVAAWVIVPVVFRLAPGP